MKSKRKPNEETSKRVGSAAGRLLALEGGKFWYFAQSVTMGGVDVTRDVRAALASALTQRPGKAESKSKSKRVRGRKA